MGNVVGKPARLTVSIMVSRLNGKRLSFQEGLQILVDPVRMIAVAGRYKIDIEPHEFELL